MGREFAWHIPNPETLWLPGTHRDAQNQGFGEVGKLKRRYPRVQDHSPMSWETLQGCSALGPLHHAEKMHPLTGITAKTEFIHFFCICHHVPVLDTLAGPGRAPPRLLPEELY